MAVAPFSGIVTARNIDNGDLVEHIVELCEKKAAEIEAQRNAEGASVKEPLEAAQ